MNLGKKLMKIWALMGAVIALAGVSSLVITPETAAFSNSFDTQKQLNEFGENVQIFLLSHSDPVFDPAIVRAEHKLMDDIADAQAKRQAADDKQAEADAEPNQRLKDRLQRTADRLDGQADKAEAGQCPTALKQQNSLARKDKSSDFIDNYITANCL